MEPTELTPEQIADAAASPSTVTTDGLTVGARSADDMIKLDQYAIEKAAATAAARPAKGAKRIRFYRGIMPGQT
ncbi:hypothetical protein [Zavarzinella formosa]|uniref:hypothetical protein n=1 Tax=Zavarzinella formosa TaxID=360055 RepID=UPI0012F834D2|nr:hypothetical protein [Zavarzinella formosa]